MLFCLTCAVFRCAVIRSDVAHNALPRCAQWNVGCFKVVLTDGEQEQHDLNGEAVLALAALQAEVESWESMAFDKGCGPC